MPDRIVVSFRGFAASKGAERYLERALAMKKRAEAHGGTLCAWSAQTFSFDFAPDELEEARSLAAVAWEETGAANERFAVGLAYGEMRVVGEGGSLAALSWGAPLVEAVALARDGRAGEILATLELGRQCS